MLYADLWGFSEKPRKNPINVPDDPGRVPRSPTVLTGSSPLSSQGGEI